MEVKLATDTAISAGGAHLLGFPGPHLIAGIFFDKGTHRTGLHALSTKYTIRIFVGAVTGSNDLGACTAITVVDGLIDLDFVAGLHASAALDTA